MISSSIIECQNQILGEVVDVTGTPFTLNYRSDRVPGRIASNTLEIPLSEDTVPASLKRIELEIRVAGQSFQQTFPAAANRKRSSPGMGRMPMGASFWAASRPSSASVLSTMPSTRRPTALAIRVEGRSRAAVREGS